MHVYFRLFLKSLMMAGTQITIFLSMVLLASPISSWPVDDPFNPRKLNACWKQKQYRDYGMPIHTCLRQMEKYAWLCYKPCKEDYIGIGPLCWERRCPEGYHDLGAVCWRPGKTVPSDNSQCPYEDKCGLTIAKGCSKCPSTLPKRNDGCTCRRVSQFYAKKVYCRGVGIPMGCSEEEEQDADGLCYKICPSNHKGQGNICWSPCPKSLQIEDGEICCGTEEECQLLINRGWRRKYDPLTDSCKVFTPV